MTFLNARLLAAHEANDCSALIGLYAEAAELAQEADAKGFYLTHAYVYALEAGSAQAQELRLQLVEMGREPPAQTEDETRR